MGAEAILDKIRKNAADEAASIRQQGAQRAEESAKQITANAKASATAILEQAQRSGADLERRERLMTGLEIRKNTLFSRRATLTKAFDAALGALTALPDDRWAALLTRIVLEAAETGTEVLAVPASDRVKYEQPFAGGKPLLERLNEALRENGRPGELTLADAPAKIAGGVLLSGKAYDVNGSFEMLLALAREDCEKEVYHTLYEL